MACIHRRPPIPVRPPDAQKLRYSRSPTLGRRRLLGTGWMFPGSLFGLSRRRPPRLTSSSSCARFVGGGSVLWRPSSSTACEPTGSTSEPCLPGSVVRAVSVVARTSLIGSGPRGTWSMVPLPASKLVPRVPCRGWRPAPLRRRTRPIGCSGPGSGVLASGSLSACFVAGRQALADARAVRCCWQLVRSSDRSVVCRSPVLRRGFVLPAV